MSVGIEDALVALLGDSTTVSALVEDRIYPIEMPPNTPMPTLVYQQISGPRVHSHSGFSSLAYPLFQISCWGDDYTEAKNLADAVMAALDGYVGTKAGVEIYALIVNGSRDMGEPEEDTYRVIVEVEAWHKVVSA